LCNASLRCGEALAGQEGAALRTGSSYEALAEMESLWMEVGSREMLLVLAFLILDQFGLACGEQRGGGLIMKGLDTGFLVQLWV